VAYRLALPPSLQGIQEVFHVCNLCKYVHGPDHIIHYEPVQIKENLTITEEPICILERRERRVRNKNSTLRQDFMEVSQSGWSSLGAWTWYVRKVSHPVSNR